MKYMITSPHTEKECLRALDETLGKGPEILKKLSFGCMAGDHTGYALVDVKDEKEARSFIHGFLISKARIAPVTEFTPEVIRSFHAKAA